MSIAVVKTCRNDHGCRHRRMLRTMTTAPPARLTRCPRPYCNGRLLLDADGELRCTLCNRTAWSPHPPPSLVPDADDRGLGIAQRRRYANRCRACAVVLDAVLALDGAPTSGIALATGIGMSPSSARRHLTV